MAMARHEHWVERARGAALITLFLLLTACSQSVENWLRFDASKQLSAVQKPSLTLVSQSTSVIETVTEATVTLTGACSSEGQPVRISGAATATATCTAGAWSALVDLSAVSDGALSFAIDHVSAQGATSTVVYTSVIKDTSSPVTATFTKSSDRFQESNVSSSFVVQISATKLYDTVLNYVVAGDATFGTDHNLTSGTVTIPAGQTSATVNFDILNNVTPQAERRLAINLTQANRTTVQLGSIANQFVDIADDDSGAYRSILSYSVGTDNGCVVYSDNKLKCWGGNSYGQVGDGTTIERPNPVAVSPASNYVSVEGGGGPSNCAISTAGLVYCWGWNGGGQLGDGTTSQRTAPVVSNGSRVFTSISGGAGPHYCGITLGKLRCWGYNDHGQVGSGNTSTQAAGFAVNPAVDYIATSVGSQHSCAITSLGAMHCWGDNVSGAVGDGTVLQRLSPVAIDAGVTYSKVGLSAYASCGITTAGVLKCWGSNLYGNVGDGTVANKFSPVVIDAGTSYAFIAGGKGSSAPSCGITTTGVLKCWGTNLGGTVGDGTMTARLTPTVIDPGVTYSSISLGRDFSCAKTTTGIVKCWGSGSAVAQPYIARDEVSPAAVDVGTTYARFSRAGSHTCAITTGGVLRCWGQNYNSQLGDGTNFHRSSPIVVMPGTGFAKVSAGAAHTCAVTTAGVLKCWGNNQYGQIGDGSNTNRLSPVTVDLGTSYKDVMAGEYSTCAITSADVLKCWGNNGAGQLADGTTTSRNSPIVVDAGVKYRTAAISITNTCAITLTKVLKCWGENSDGQIGNGTQVDSLTPVVITSGTSYDSVAVSDYGYSVSTCAVTDTGVLKCWGDNTNSKLGDGTTTRRTSPVTINAGTAYSSVRATIYGACALTTGGVAKCWGDNNDGQLGNGTRTDATTPVVAGAGTSFASVDGSGDTACGITTAGALKCWGSTRYSLFARNDRQLIPTAVSRLLEP